MVRILQIVCGMNMGGIETLLMNIYRNIDRTKIQFDFVVYGEKHYYEAEILSLGGMLYCFPDGQGKLKERIQLLEQFLREHPEYEIAHHHMSCVSGTALLTNRTLKKCGIKKIILHSHASIVNANSARAKLVHHVLKKINIRYATDFYACAKIAGEHMYGKKLFFSKGHVLHNGIDAKKFEFDGNIRTQVREELGLQNQFVIGHVGRFSYPKNHEFLIDIFYECLKQNPNTVLLLCGNGELQSDIENKVYALGIQDNVVFLGIRNDIHRLMQAIDIFVFPSRFEGLGIVAIEAQAAGLPVIASNEVPVEIDITELAHHIPLNRSPRVWAEEIIKWKEYHRENNYELIRKSGYDILDVVKKLELLYTEKKISKERIR